MILKSLSRKSNGSQLMKYIFRYINDDQKRAGLSEKEISKSHNHHFFIRHNIRSRSSIKNLIKEFKENESYRLVRRKDSVKIFHTILSFAGKDRAHVNDKLLKDISKKFIEERGLSNLYVGAKHQDKDHVHLHIAVSGTQLNGRSS